MRRAATFLSIFALTNAASAQSQKSDEVFFQSFLPLMIGIGIFIAVFVVVVNVVAARRRALRATPPLFDPTLGPGLGPYAGAPGSPPRVVSKKTTTTNADGSVTVTVVEETIVGSPSYGSANGVIDPELFTSNGLGGELEQEVLAEVRDAFRRMGSQNRSS